MPQALRGKTIGASYGDAFLAALAVGDVDAHAIAGWNPVVGEIVPNDRNRLVYDRQFEIFKALYRNTSDLMHRLA